MDNGNLQTPCQILILIYLSSKLSRCFLSSYSYIIAFCFFRNMDRD